MARNVYDRVGNYFKTTKANTPSSPLVNGHSARKPSQSHSASFPPPQTPRDRSSSVQDAQGQRSASAKIEIAIPSRSFDSASYVDVDNESVAQEAVSATATSAPLQQHTQATFLPPADPTTSAVQDAPGGSKTGFSIVLSPKKFDKDEYLDVADIAEPLTSLSARKKDRRDFSDTQAFFGESLDQRQRADAAVDAMDKLIRSVYQAVGSVLAGDPGFDHIVVLNREQQPALTGTFHQKLHAAVQKVIDLKGFDRVPLEYLLQVQKLSEANMKHIEDFSLRIDENWEDEAVETWLQQVPDLDTALKASRTCLRLLSAGREEKQLYSETMIQMSVNLFKNITDDIIIPIVEMRNNGPASKVFRALSKNKKVVSTIFMSCQKLFALLAELVTKIELSEMAMNSLEFTASRLIFVENAYYERDSVVGTQRFDGIRVVAMDMLCQIFMMKPQQRQGIIDDMLTSLEKLPVGKQGSRQYKLGDGGNIQPLSALIMRLIQASAGRIDDTKDVGRTALLRDLGANGQEPDEAKARYATASIKSEEQAADQHAVAIQELESAASPLNDAAQRYAAYVVNFIVQRAMKSTKTGDTPYRNLLDLFVEDFTVCLDMADWPSAELLLRQMMLMMVQIFEAPKSAAPAKNMALELLGVMSGAVSKLRSQVEKTASALEGGSSDELSQYLSDLATHVLSQKTPVEHIVGWTGPFRASLEHLQQRCADDPYLASSAAFMITSWATRTFTGYSTMSDDDLERDREMGRLAYRLRRMVEDRNWLSSEYTFKAVEESQARLSYTVLVLCLPFCEAYDRILNIQIRSMLSDQATVRSRSLKSVSQVIEIDPSILDGDSPMLQGIKDCAVDSSPQVRDSALGLIGICLTVRPVLEASLAPTILDRFLDSGVGVRKRAMKLARDIYLRNRGKGIRSAIAKSFLRRVNDRDEGVQDLARQVIEEVWFAPFYNEASTAAYRTAIAEHVALIVQTVKSEGAGETLDKVFQMILRPNNKSLEGPFSVCSKLVAIMFGQIDNVEASESAGFSGRDALQVLTTFARADPTLFNFEQMRMLRPQLSTLGTPEESAAFHAVTIIYTCVLPELPVVHNEWLTETRKTLLQSIPKVSQRKAFDDLIACIRTACDLLKSYGPMAMAVISSIQAVRRLKGAKLMPNQIGRFEAYARIVGGVSRHLDLDQHIGIFKEKMPDWKGNSVPKLILDLLVPFAAPTQALEGRKAAIEAIGHVCQARPRNYVLPQVYTTFSNVFEDREPSLELMILQSFKAFLVIEEKRSEAGGDAANSGKKKELTVMGGTSFDDVASATTQRFLKDITRIALSSQDIFAFTAMEVLGSINRQGLTHPKETGVTLITLETSSNPRIAELAFFEHRALHEKHETVLEREYVKAVQAAYNYQRDVVKDTHGATTKDGFQSKLHFLIDVMKISKMKNRQRFLEKLCGQIEFDVSKLDAKEGMPREVDFARFILENAAYFEYQTIGEIQTAVNTLEKLVNTLGIGVAQAIESEVFDVRMDVDAEGEMDGGAEAQLHAEAAMNGQPQQPPVPQMLHLSSTVNPNRLVQLTAASLILSATWETRTYLRRLYGMGSNRHENKAKEKAKDLNRSPVKVQGIHGDKFWDEMTSLMGGTETPDMMMQKCKAFVDVLNVDKDFQVADEEDDLELEEPGTPEDGEEGDPDGFGDRGRKRKGGSTPGGRKKRARSSSQQRKRGRPRKARSTEPESDVDADGDWI